MTDSEMTYSQYELETLRNGENEKKRQHAAAEADKQRKHEARMERFQTFLFSFGALMVATTILGIVFMIWQGNKGPSAADEKDERLRNECVSHGGTMLSLENGNTSGEPTCLFLKEAP